MSKQGELTKPPVPNVSDATTISLRAHQPFFFLFYSPSSFTTEKKFVSFSVLEGTRLPSKRDTKIVRRVFIVFALLLQCHFFFYTGNEMIILHVWEADRIRVFAWVRSKGG